MGFAAHSIESLGLPFLLVDETVFVIPKASTLRLTKHHFKILFILSGQAEHEIDSIEGRQPLRAGDILVAPVVKRHDYINPDPRDAAALQTLRFFFDSDHLEQHMRRRLRRPETDLTDFLLHHFQRVNVLKHGIDSEVTQLINAFRAEADDRLTGYRHRIRSICTDLIIAVARRLESGRDKPSLAGGSGAQQIVASAKEYMLKHFATPLTLEDVAWHVRKGEEHLARVFKRQTGQSVFDYVRELRIHHAKTLLQDASLTLTEIAKRCGFNSLSFFSRAFREQVGISPSRYRGHVTFASTSTSKRRRSTKPRARPGV